MTLDLDAILARQKSVYEHGLCDGKAWISRDAIIPLHCLVMSDIPALVDEVRRLRERLAMATEIRISDDYGIYHGEVFVVTRGNYWVINLCRNILTFWNETTNMWGPDSTNYPTADAAIEVAKRLCEVNEHA